MSDLGAETEQELLRGREKLEELSKTGEYVFHGSPQRLDRLEPRQQTHVSKKTGKTEPDGDPAVCTTESPDVAIFRSLISSHVAKKAGLKWYWSEFGIKDRKPYFKATQESLDQARKPDSLGYVHVFKKADFAKRDELEWRSDHEVEPVQVIEVKASDLPQNIEVIPDRT